MHQRDADWLRAFDSEVEAAAELIAADREARQRLWRCRRRRDWQGADDAIRDLRVIRRAMTGLDRLIAELFEFDEGRPFRSQT